MLKVSSRRLDFGDYGVFSDTMLTGLVEAGLEREREIRIEPSWKEVLKGEFDQPYFKSLREFIRQEIAAGYRIYPPASKIFAAFDETPFDRVKVVLLGQDPYHGEGQANGLCFSVCGGIRKPPSLLNIFKELQQDLGIPVPVSGDLLPWARQGVLLLNATITVRANQPGSHQSKGWETFTDAVIRALSAKKKNVVFLLWGRYAQAKAALIDQSRHHILTAAHPSPLARTGFSGCRHFSKTNALLLQSGIDPVDWKLE